jgi:hypothetical protein
MTAIKQISVRIKTANKGYAGTSGRVYLGIGGREFGLTLLGHYDFAPGTDQTFVMGEDSTIGAHPANNDPRSPQIDTESLNKYPIYVRFEPRAEDDLWGIEEISVSVNPGSTQFSALGKGSILWMGNSSSKIIYFGAG